MNILTIILLILLAVIFKVGFALLRFLISAAFIILGLYLAYQGVLWILENFNVLSAYIDNEKASYFSM